MLDLRMSIELANQKRDAIIKKARTNPKLTKEALEKIDERSIRTYYDRLRRAILKQNENETLHDSHDALCTAIPELLMVRIYDLAWGKARHNKNEHSIKGMENENKLLKKYFESFEKDCNIKQLENLIQDINSKAIDKVLLCHGLSAIDDSILLFAEIGRVLRIANALGIKNTEIMLADMSWIKYNRSLKQLFVKNNDFLNALRICSDKRERLYRALGIPCHVFGFSDYLDEDTLSKDLIMDKVEKLRKLAVFFWGDDCLSPHDQKMQKLIGEPIEKILYSDVQSKLKELMELQINSDVRKIPHSIEESYKIELTALRTISSLFSTFDKEVFVYFITQFFAQSSYNNYLKIAPCSEAKFDKTFEEKGTLFNNIVEFGEKGSKDNFYCAYLSQYYLGIFKVLPYTSTSEDMMRNKFDLDTIKMNLILLGDYNQEETEKVKSVILSTPIEHRNRLMSDLLTFYHALITRKSAVLKIKHEEMQEAINGISPDIADQIFDSTNICEEYRLLCIKWLENIDRFGETIVPYHIIPYLWDEADWNDDKIKYSVRFIQLILKVYSKIVE